MSTTPEQTRCPHCNIAFYVSATQLKAARGTVRCGICLNVFDAAEHRCVSPLAPAAHLDLDHPGPTAESQESSASRGSRDTDDAGTAPASLGESADNKSADEQVDVDRDAAATTAIPTVTASDTAPNQPGLDLDRLAAMLAPTGDTPIAFDNEPLYQATNLDDSPRSRERHLFTFAACAILIAALSLQLLFHYSASLSLNPNYRAAVELLCSQLNCRVAELRDTRLVSVEAVSIKKHTPATDALTMEAILINRASYTQPFPIITLSFKDISGQTVAERSFGPNLYLPGRLKEATAMQPSLAYQAHLELVAPDQDAVSYSLIVREN